MKKYAFLMVFFLFSVIGNAQEQHLKFMGIPLNGLISQFHVKLQNKGLRYDAEATKNLKAGGCRVYTGLFAGTQSDIYVYFNTKTQNVYRAKAVMEEKNLDDVKKLFYKYKDMLDEKYETAIGEDLEQDGYPAYDLTIFNSDDNIIGSIQLFINLYLRRYSFYIDYKDFKNYRANEKSNMDDL